MNKALRASEIIVRGEIKRALSQISFKIVAGKRLGILFGKLTLMRTDIKIYILLLISVLNVFFLKYCL